MSKRLPPKCRTTTQGDTLTFRTNTSQSQTSRPRLSVKKTTESVHVQACFLIPASPHFHSFRPYLSYRTYLITHDTDGYISKPQRQLLDWIRRRWESDSLRRGKLRPGSTRHSKRVQTFSVLGLSDQPLSCIRIPVQKPRYQNLLFPRISSPSHVRSRDLAIALASLLAMTCNPHFFIPILGAILWPAFHGWRN
jgi:hypothetical protein